MYGECLWILAIILPTFQTIGKVSSSIVYLLLGVDGMRFYNVLSLHSVLSKFYCSTHQTRKDGRVWLSCLEFVHSTVDLPTFIIMYATVLLSAVRDTCKIHLMH